MHSTLYRDLVLAEEAGGCFLCLNAPCEKACPFQIPVEQILRSVRFENVQGAAQKLPEELPCNACGEKPCMAACLKGRVNRPVAIPSLLELAASCRRPRAEAGKVDLSVNFCGVHCENPFFLSSSVVGSNYEMVAKAFSMGWAGVAFKTIGNFVPEEVSPRFATLRKEGNPFLGFKNIEQISDHTLQENLEFLRRLKRDYPEKILIASIMGQNEAEWEYLARVVTSAGADILECNFSCPHMAADGLGSDVGQDPALVAAYTRAARRGTEVPILAKMTPNIGNIEVPALAAMQAGADGIAAINTIKSLLNVNLENFSSAPEVVGKTSVGGYSGKAIKPIALRYIYDIKNCAPLNHVPVSGMGGIETWRDAAEFLAMGCETVQVTTSVMQYGYRIVSDLLEGLRLYLEENGFASVRELVGRALPNIVPAESLDRSGICYPHFRRKACVGCGRCVLSCYDGGHQALRRNEADGKPILDSHKCVGCHLCLLVCPAQAIAPGVRVAKKQREAAF